MMIIQSQGQLARIFAYDALACPADKPREMRLFI
jgi:hypothetical protein